MRKVLIGAILALIVAFSLSGCSNTNAAETNSPAADTQGIHWYTWEEAVAASNKAPKKFFVDVYTDWCGWCKKMDATTFADPAVAQFVNQHFYPVKLDAEQTEDILFAGKTFRYIQSGSRGVHELAYALLDGQLGYPSYVYLDERKERIAVSPGYKTVEGLMQEMQAITAQN